MAKIGFAGSGSDLITLRAAGADSCYIGTWSVFQNRLKPGDTAMVTRADRISRSEKRRETVTRKLAAAGVTLVILAGTSDTRNGD